MKLSMLAVAAAAQVLTMGTPPQNPLVTAVPDGTAELTPDFVLRGRTTTVVVIGDDEAALKTFRIDPANGVTVGAITPLSPRADGRKSASVEITVAAGAQPGERAVMLTIAPRMAGMDAVTRPGAASASGEVDRFVESLIARETKPRPVASITINSHEITISSAAPISKDGETAIEIHVDDLAGDVDVAAPSGASGDGISIVSLEEEIVASELICGTDHLDGVVSDVRRLSSAGGKTVLIGDLSELPKEVSAPCEVRLRVRDKEKNISKWFSIRLPR